MAPQVETIIGGLWELTGELIDRKCFHEAYKCLLALKRFDQGKGRCFLLLFHQYK